MRITIINLFGSYSVSKHDERYRLTDLRHFSSQFNNRCLGQSVPATGYFTPATVEMTIPQADRITPCLLSVEKRPQRLNSYLYVDPHAE